MPANRKEPQNACPFCTSNPDELYGDELWSVWGAAKSPAGSVILQSRRHTERLEDLTPEELAALGPMLKRVTAAVRTATGADKVYLSVFLEMIPHFHLMLLPRDSDVVPEHRGANLILNAETYAPDHDRGRDVAEDVARLIAAG